MSQISFTYRTKKENQAKEVLNVIISKRKEKYNENKNQEKKKTT